MKETDEFSGWTIKLMNEGKDKMVGNFSEMFSSQKFESKLKDMIIVQADKGLNSLAFLLNYVPSPLL